MQWLSNANSAFQNKVDQLTEGTILDATIFEDVSLPADMGLIDRIKNVVQLSKQTNRDVLLNVSGRKGPGKEIDELLGKVKMDANTEPLRKIFTMFVNDVIKLDVNDPDPIDGYLYFGNKNFKKSLAVLCQVNPFFASALTVSADDKYLELVAYSPKPKAATDSKYLTLSRTMTDPSHRINVRFNMDMTVNQITKFDKAGKAEIVSEADWDYYASGAMYNMIFYVTAIHTTIHVLHHLMTAAIISSTRHDDSLAAWANPYDDNIAIKYLEVAALLFHSSIQKDPTGKTQIVSGELGFGASDAVLPVLREKVLCVWGGCKDKDDFMKNFLLKDLYDTAKNPEEVIKKASILTEVTKHIDNVDPFGKDIAAAMKANDKEAFDTAEAKLKSFMNGTGVGVSSIDSIDSWVQLMCCTGITHGCTLSYTRMLFVPEVMSWRNIGDPIWDENDISVMTSALGTIVGVTPDRHVFAGEIEHGFEWETDDISKNVKYVLDKYDELAETLKKEYKDVITKREDFREYGWILTDHCEDGYDGKQHTITSYI
jgi:hypothetical protein